MKNVWAWLFRAEPGTWWGHWLQAIVGFWVGYLPMAVLLDTPFVVDFGAGLLSGLLIVAGAFWHREGDDIRKAKEKLGSWRAAIREKGLDGWMDATMPLLGCFVCFQVVSGGPGDVIAAVMGSALYWGIVVAYRFRGRYDQVFRVPA